MRQWLTMNLPRGKVGNFQSMHEKMDHFESMNEKIENFVPIHRIGTYIECDKMEDFLPTAGEETTLNKPCGKMGDFESSSWENGGFVFYVLKI